MDVIVDFGAKGDGKTDDTQAIKNAIASRKPLIFPAGIYIMNDKLILDGAATSNLSWEGAGSTTTIIKFTNTALTNLVERINRASSNFRIKGITFQGFGKTVGNCNGIVSEYGGRSLSYNLRMEDVAVTDVSENGFVVTDWFQQAWVGCYARHIGGDGFHIGGDQSSSFIGSGSFSSGIDGYAWWFYSGSPFLQGLNVGDSSNGLKFGTPASHPYGTKYCFPTIIGLNVESIITAHGIGLYFERGSSPNFMVGVVIYAYQVAALYGIYFNYLGNAAIMSKMPTIIASSGGSFQSKIYINGASTNGSLVFFEPVVSTDFGGSAAKRYIEIKSDPSNSVLFERVITDQSFKNNGALYYKSKVITSSVNIRRNSGTQDDNVLLVDATNGNITISLDFASYMADRVFIIKRIDSSTNTVTITSYTSNFDGATNIALSPLQKVKLISNSSKWYII